MKKKQFGLATLNHGMAKKSTDYLKEVQKELVEEEQEALKDFIKGAYRVVVEKEREIENLQREVKEVRTAIDKAGKGNWKALADVKVPARFMSEATLRKHGKSLLEGSSEIRIMELYTPESED